MKTNFEIKQIGKVSTEKGFTIEIDEKFKDALKNIEGFSHLQILWWANKHDTDRDTLTTKKPYKNSPSELGIFGTRSPIRPNPIMITNVFVLNIDYEKGIIHIPYIDADNETPVIDIKPYHYYERINSCQVPNWCNHWPKSYEESADFEWENEFNF
jgi:tRNA-Thr(GGU) m(6)t(6)A37 methyltransferase TsaA